MLYERDYLLGLTEAEKQEYEEATYNGIVI